MYIYTNDDLKRNTMKRITVKQIRLLNFKGIRNLQVRFDDRLTRISGTNGVGKSTIFDAFCWLMFGKNSADKKDFTLKTTDDSGRAIPKLPHEVEAIIGVGDTEVTLKRCYMEKWTKKRGEAEEQFCGHSEERYYNGVPCSATEYDAKIKDICSEELFKFITNPSYFPTRKEDMQRQLLFNMAGGVSDEEIARGNQSFQSLLSELSGKTMEEYKRELAAKKRKVKAEVDSLPTRIDERKRDLKKPPLGHDMDVSELMEKKAARAKVDAQIADFSKACQAANEERRKLLSELNGYEIQRMRRETSIASAVRKEYNNAMAVKSGLEQELRREKAAMERNKQSLTACRNALERYAKEREQLIEVWRRLAKEIAEANAPMNEQMFICPTCGRHYELDEIEQKRKEITLRYLDDKLSEKEQNRADGEALMMKKKQTEADAEELEALISRSKETIQTLSNDPRMTVTMKEPDVDAAIRNDEQIKMLDEKIAAVTAQINKPIEVREQTELTEAKQVLTEAIETLQKRIFDHQKIVEDNERNLTRIAELEKDYKVQNATLAFLEQLEFTMQEFSKARTRAIEDKINGLFTMVKFKLFDTQVNGAEVECCVPMINGVPYADANTAGKINAGLDIINAISKVQEIEAPIFIDGAESINNLLPTDSQVISLIVTQEENLTVTVPGQAPAVKTLFD